MSAEGLLLVAFVMAVGVVGVLIPVVPGLLLVAGAALVWALTEQDTLSWVVFAAMLVVLGMGTAAKYVLPARNLAAAGAPRSTMMLGQSELSSASSSSQSSALWSAGSAACSSPSYAG